MKTREEYKKHYLNKLNKQFGNPTQADYNSAEDFCYKEEWKLGEKGNMGAAIDGLGDAWMEYKKQSEVMNSRNTESLNKIFSNGENLTDDQKTIIYGEKPRLKNKENVVKALKELYPESDFQYRENSNGKYYFGYIYTENANGENQRIGIDFIKDDWDGKDISLRINLKDLGDKHYPITYYYNDFKKSIKNEIDWFLNRDIYSDINVYYDKALDYVETKYDNDTDFQRRLDVYAETTYNKLVSKGNNTLESVDKIISRLKTKLNNVKHYTEMDSLYKELVVSERLKELMTSGYFDNAGVKLVVKRYKLQGGIYDPDKDVSSKTIGATSLDKLKDTLNATGLKFNGGMYGGKADYLKVGEKISYSEPNWNAEGIVETCYDAGIFIPDVERYKNAFLPDKTIDENMENKNIKSSYFVDERFPDEEIPAKEMEDIITKWALSDEFKEQFEWENNFDEKTYNEYFDRQGNPKWYKIYKDFFDISSNGAFSEINSSYDKTYNPYYKENPKSLNDYKSENERDAWSHGFEAAGYYNRFVSTADRNLTGAGKCPYNEPELQDAYYNGWEYNLRTNERLNSSRRNNMIKSTRDHYLLGKQNFLTKHVRGIDDDGDYEMEELIGNELYDVEYNLFEQSSTGYIGFDIEKHKGGKISTEYEIFDWDGLMYDIEGEDTKNGAAVYDDSGTTVIAIMGSNWENTKTGEQGTDYVLYKAIDLNAEPEIESSRKNNMKIKSDIDWESAKHAFDDKKYLIYKTGIDDEWEEFPFYGTDNAFTADEYERKGYKVEKNNMIKSGYTGTNVSVEYGPYSEEKEFPFYDMKGETVEQIDEIIGYYDEVKTVWGSDGESYMILQDRADSEDKIAVLEDDYNEWVEAMNNEDYSKLLGNSHKVIKSANGSWEYQSDDMDEAEAKIGDIGISFTEPLLVADDGTIFTRAGFNEWLKFLEREYPDNWADAYEAYHRDSDEEFIAMCEEPYFNHDFGNTLFLYSEGLKSIAESIANEIPSRKPAVSIPSGFAFELYPEEEEPSGFNSFWIDDLQLNSDSFIWGINPSIGNRFDVIINPDYLWNGTENINSNRRTNMKKTIKSGRYIKSGTSNFADNRASVDFPLVAYFAENYVYDEETDSETEERDYDADSWEYEDAYDFAKELAEEMGIEISDFDIHRMRYDSRDAGYEQPFFVGIGSGYYDGLQIFIDDNLYFSPEDIANDEGLLDEFEYAEDQGDYDRVVKEVEERVQNEWAAKINEYLNKLCSEYGWIKLGVSARFSNGETWYSKIDNSRKPIQSKITQRELRDMINQGQAIDITYGDAPEGVRLDVLQVSKGTYGMNGALFKGSDGNLYVIGGRTSNLFRYV